MDGIDIRKGEVIQGPNAYSSVIYLVEQGILRSYFMDEQGKQHVYMFYREDNYIFNIEGKVIRGDFFLEAIEDSKIKVLHSNEMPAGERFNQLANSYLTSQKRIVMLMSYNAVKKYEYFQATYPEIVNRIPQKFIASFLGITPETFSTIKGRKLRCV